jgi:hypothetical protein
MTRTGQAAADYALGRVGGTMPDSGLCLQFTRQCFEVASYYYSAIDAWNASPTKHPGDRNPPLAVPVYFKTPSIYDHVCITVGGGQIVSTYSDRIYLYSSIAEVERVFEGPYLGWAEDINRVTVWTPSTPTPPPPLEDDNVGTYFEATSGSGAIRAGWVYEQDSSGALRALGSQESGAHAQVHPAAWAARAKWSGPDLANLAASNGLWEYTGSTYPIGLSGRVLGRNAPVDVDNGQGTLTPGYPPVDVGTGDVSTYSADPWRGAVAVILALGIVAILVLIALVAAFRGGDLPADAAAQHAYFTGAGIVIGALATWLTAGRRRARRRHHHHRPRFDDPALDPNLDLRVRPQDRGGDA